MTSEFEPIHIIDDITPPEERLGPSWRVLVVDTIPTSQEQDDMVLVGVVYKRRPVGLFFANSLAQAQQVLVEHGHETFAVALIDLAMGDEIVGIRLIEHIRSVLGNVSMRIILRTGYIAYVPEGNVVQRWDLDGCYVKTNLHAQQLIAVVCASLGRFPEDCARL